MAVHPVVIPHRTLHALCISTFIILSISSSTASVRFAVIGPDQPLVVLPGEDAVLRCRLEPQISAENLTVRWFRGYYRDVVHLYEQGRDRYEDQMTEYRGRTALIKTDIRFGIVSLIIHNVRPSDSGQYSCFFDAGSFYEEAVVQLKVEAVGSRPHMYLEESQNGGMQIVCISSGWYPEPEVLWKDDNGEHLPSSSEVNTPEGSLRFHIKATYIITGDANTFSCRINNSALSQWKESTLHISDSFFRSVSTCSTTRILICAAFTVLEIAFLSLAAYHYKRRRKLIGTLSARVGTLKEELGTLKEELANLPQKRVLVTLDPDSAHHLLVLTEERRRVRGAGTAQPLLDNPRRFTVLVTLDPDSAHPLLILSEERRRVRGACTAQPLLENPRRFTGLYSCVLGSEGFTSGRHYWELQLLQEGILWSVRVAGESVPRKGEITWSPEGGVWAVQGWYNGEFSALTSPRFPLSPRERPWKLGVYLDYEGGLVSLYNADTMEHLYTFPQASFTQRIFPFFCLWEAELRLV